MQEDNVQHCYCFILPRYMLLLLQCMLAAIILVALKGMFKQFAELRRLWEISFIDFVSSHLGHDVLIWDIIFSFGT